jgi:GTP-binding protein Era
MLHTIAINTHDVDNLQPLITLIKPFLQHDQLQQVQSTVENDKFVISEIIREQIIFNTKQELPYATGVTVEMLEYLKNKNLTNISAVIYVEKASQKPIVIGHGGEMIKKIGTIARKELLKVYNSKINLKLFVKVQSN